MAKGKKGKEKSKKSSAVSPAATTAVDLPDYYYGTSTFQFPNNDRYEGEFCAHRIGLVWREGYGTYTTHDGQIYKGEWKEDKLVETKNVKVTFPNGAEYSGKLSKGKYSGPATYTLPNGMIINSDFTENKPSKDTILIDVLDKLWCGFTKINNDCTYLLPENELYLNIDENRGRGIQKSKPIKLEKPTENQEEQSNVEEEQEEVIFAKSTKTKHSINNLQDSPWYQRYANFKIKHDEIKQKIKDEGQSALSEDQQKWWIKYQKHKKRKVLKSHPIEPKNILNGQSSSSTPVVVFYSSKQPGDVEIAGEAESELSSKTGKEKTNERVLGQLYQKLKNEKKETEMRMRQKILNQSSNSKIYDRKRDDTKNPDCSCGKRICDCLLHCV